MRASTSAAPDVRRSRPRGPAWCYRPVGSADVPVILLFGADDHYLSLELGGHLAGPFARADLHSVEDAPIGLNRISQGRSRS